MALNQILLLTNLHACGDKCLSIGLSQQTRFWCSLECVDCLNITQSVWQFISGPQSHSREWTQCPKSEENVSTTRLPWAAECSLGLLSTVDMGDRGLPSTVAWGRWPPWIQGSQLPTEARGL